MSTETKLAAFDYVVTRLREWYGEENGDWNNNDLSRLKITKLLFFVTAVTTSEAEAGLLNTFDKFTAMPYGHVESEIQDHMHESSKYSISTKNASFKEGITAENAEGIDSKELRQSIDNAVSNLKQINKDLITYDAFRLVDLSHRWQSWKTVFSIAKKNGKFSMPIPNSMIMVEPKIFK